ncbi:methyltransferase domain-containing protein [Mycolicibacterium sp. 624]|uniref:class I SAM-dependent methyltransferase n=1 Tax=Mycolicibacterium sp. 624 TaxID=3156314 RepID=UPI00339660DF
MAMNMLHRLCCSSTLWARSVERTLLPWALSDVDLGDDALEIGPGYGANLRVLAGMTPRLTCVEIDPPLADRLSRRYGSHATIVTGDGTATGLPEARFSSVVCFTMLHHVPTQSLQDRLFTEAFRVLERGGTFAGSDGIDSIAFRLVHIGDTYNPIGPDTLPNRLRAAGFADVTVETRGGQQRWRAIKA